MIIDDILLLKNLPKQKGVMWAKPKGDSLELNLFYNNKWNPITGGDDSYKIDLNATLITEDTNLNAILYQVKNLLGSDFNPPADLSEEEQTEYMVNLVNLNLSSMKFTSVHGEAVVDKPLEYNKEDKNNAKLTFICEDGATITTTPYGSLFEGGSSNRLILDKLSRREAETAITNKAEFITMYHGKVVSSYIDTNNTRGLYFLCEDGYIYVLMYGREGMTTKNILPPSFRYLLYPKTELSVVELTDTITELTKFKCIDIATGKEIIPDLVLSTTETLYLQLLFVLKILGDSAEYVRDLVFRFSGKYYSDGSIYQSICHFRVYSGSYHDVLNLFIINVRKETQLSEGRIELQTIPLVTERKVAELS